MTETVCRSTSQPDDAKQRVRAQYGAAGDAYVKSAGHSSGPDLDRMIETARPLPTDRLLDVATGGGHVARIFAPYVTFVVASDLTPEILHHAEAAFRKQGLMNVETAIADAEDLPFDDASFEIVTCRIAPHHFPHPDRFIAETARVLRAGGRFVLIDSTVPDGEAGVFLNRVEQLRDPSHVRSLTTEAWRDLLANAGFEIQVVEPFVKRHDFEDWTTRSRMSPPDRAALERLLLDAPESLKATLQIAESGNRVLAFSDIKTLFASVRP